MTVRERLLSDVDDIVRMLAFPPLLEAAIGWDGRAQARLGAAAKRNEKWDRSI